MEKECRWRGLIKINNNVDIILKFIDKFGTVIIYVIVIVLLILLGSLIYGTFSGLVPTIGWFISPFMPSR